VGGRPGTPGPVGGPESKSFAKLTEGPAERICSCLLGESGFFNYALVMPPLQKVVARVLLT